jgi:hypothetical protein
VQLFQWTVPGDLQRISGSKNVDKKTTFEKMQKMPKQACRQIGAMAITTSGLA